MTLVAGGRERRYDRVIVATHADTALGLLAAPTDAERRVLGAFRYSRNRTVLHTDRAFLPRTPRAHAAWNYVADPDTARVAVTYSMTILQGLPGPRSAPYLVTLNPRRGRRGVLSEAWMDHPQLDGAALAAQAEAGAARRRAAHRVRGRARRVRLPRGRHARRARGRRAHARRRGRMLSSLVRGELVHARADHLARRVFRYPVYMAAIELGELPALDRTLRLFSHNRRNPFLVVRSRLHDAAAGRTARCSRTCASPATCSIRSASLSRRARDRVVAEVNNTYGGRHSYELGDAERVPDRGAARRLSQRADVLRVAVPARPRELRVLVRRRTARARVDDRDARRAARVPHVHRALHRHARRGSTDRALLAAAVRYPLMTAQVIALIHYEAIKLRLLGVPYRRPGVDHKPLDT